MLRSRLRLKDSDDCFEREWPVLPPSQDAGSDRIIWKWSSAGRFSSSKMHKQFVGRRNMFTPVDGSMVWKINAPQSKTILVVVLKESGTYEWGQSGVRDRLMYNIVLREKWYLFENRWVKLNMDDTLLVKHHIVVVGGAVQGSNGG
ncbi:hypothetical protein J1N35_019920 [Gossypium stocksii]|uniref:Uncharacterized protein n=1 Tax=Gossypium stocksii TaxID=47602 RepID=A0A9D3VCX4_9ROSI|nr:hypothetical protein J1N35_019920 [Gossypium stocksii]